MAVPFLLRSLYSSTKKSFSSSSSSPLSSSPYRFFSRAFSSAPAVATNPTVSPDPSRLRNVAVIAHVDHGKTTLMDRLLRQCGADIPHERAMDSINLEIERGITISSKVRFTF
jgi:GTP-binding protein